GGGEEKGNRQGAGGGEEKGNRQGAKNAKERQGEGASPGSLVSLFPIRLSLCLSLFLAPLASWRFPLPLPLSAPADA
ncbi:MAG: hypothetical protein ACK4YP_02665, partial [Myxococcota bacterium]